MRTLAMICMVWLLVAACSSDSEIGESCDSVASTDECVEDAICTNEEDDTAVCRLICEDQEDCPADHSCNGVSGTSTKSCQPDN